MTIYKKLAEARVKLQELNLKKSGMNKFSKFSYYELADFLPAINKINSEIGIISVFNFTNEVATLEIIDTEDYSKIAFTIPTTKADMKGSQAIQELGATETYLRRYLFLAAYEITENDVVDSLPKEVAIDPIIKARKMILELDMK
ncbi:MAG: ERF family protein, partial [Fusobacteriaceae bacterium]